MLYTLINVPYGALNASLTRDTDEITTLTSVRMFLANTGIRPSEYYKIKWKDITIHNQNGIKLLYISVPDNTKTGRRIVVGLPETYTCFESIKSFSKYTKENDYVFTRVPVLLPVEADSDTSLRPALPTSPYEPF